MKAIKRIKIKSLLAFSLALVMIFAGAASWATFASGGYPSFSTAPKSGEQITTAADEEELYDGLPIPDDYQLGTSALFNFTNGTITAGNITGGTTISNTSLVATTGVTKVSYVMYEGDVTTDYFLFLTYSSGFLEVPDADIIGFDNSCNDDDYTYIRFFARKEGETSCRIFSKPNASSLYVLDIEFKVYAKNKNGKRMLNNGAITPKGTLHVDRTFTYTGTAAMFDISLASIVDKDAYNATGRDFDNLGFLAALEGYNNIYFNAQYGAALPYSGGLAYNAANRNINKNSNDVKVYFSLGSSVPKAPSTYVDIAVKDYDTGEVELIPIKIVFKYNNVAANALGENQSGFLQAYNRTVASTTASATLDIAYMAKDKSLFAGFYNYTFHSNHFPTEFGSTTATGSGTTTMTFTNTTLGKSMLKPVIVCGLFYPASAGQHYTTFIYYYTGNQSFSTKAPKPKLYDSTASAARAADGTVLTAATRNTTYTIPSSTSGVSFSTTNPIITLKGTKPSIIKADNFVTADPPAAGQPANEFEITKIMSFSSALINASLRDGELLVNFRNSSTLTQLGFTDNVVGIYGAEVTCEVLNKSTGMYSFVTVYFRDDGTTTNPTVLNSNWIGANNAPEANPNSTSGSMHRGGSYEFIAKQSTAEPENNPSIAIDTDEDDKIYFRSKTSDGTGEIALLRYKATTDGAWTELKTELDESGNPIAAEIPNYYTVELTQKTTYGAGSTAEETGWHGLKFTPLGLYNPEIDPLLLSIRVIDTKGGESYIPIELETYNKAPQANPSLSSSYTIYTNSRAGDPSVQFTLEDVYTLIVCPLLSGGRSN